MLKSITISRQKILIKQDNANITGARRAPARFFQQIDCLLGILGLTSLHSFEQERLFRERIQPCRRLHPGKAAVREASLIVLKFLDRTSHHDVRVIWYGRWKSDRFLGQAQVPGRAQTCKTGNQKPKNDQE